MIFVGVYSFLLMIKDRGEHYLIDTYLHKKEVIQFGLYQNILPNYN